MAWADGVVPLWADMVGADGELLHFMLGDLDAGRVVAVQGRRSDTQPGLGGGRADELGDDFVGAQWLAGPVPADLAEQTMLDGIPFGGPGRVVRKSDAQAQAIAQLTLNLSLPGATLSPIAATGIGQDEDVAGLRVALAAFL